ncbi:unnamed protein product [Prorocentrum cordatum]|uniref:Uncharacterized protein n=1 Tax=Prorocentrum cordatum TaxID=2364126 RepID=A0ABN9UKG4_9DINO|nr:unnamed protein product [Polarella glacialis]
MTFVVTAVTLLRASTEADLKEVEAHAVKTLQEIQGLPLRQPGLMAPAFRVRVRKAMEGQDQMAHFEWAIDTRSKTGQNLHELVLRTFELQGAERTSGSTPRGPMAREIQSLTSGKK